jgi:hypothetical protein
MSKRIFLHTRTPLMIHLEAKVVYTLKRERS